MALTNKDINDPDIFWIEDAEQREGAAADRFSIGELSREFGVTLRALRFYEDRGLINPRREGLTRIYSASDRNRLQIILKGKRLGFTLAEVAAMIEAHERQDGVGQHQLALSREKCLEQIAHLEQQKREIEDAIVELRATYEALAEIMRADARR